MIAWLNTVFMHRLLNNTLTLARARTEHATQYGRQNIHHHHNDITTAFYFVTTWSKFYLSLHVKRVRGFRWNSRSRIAREKKMKVDKKYTLILQLAGGLSIQRFSVLLAVISEPTLMKACHWRRLYVRMLGGTGVEGSNVLCAATKQQVI